MSGVKRPFQLSHFFGDGPSPLGREVAGRDNGGTPGLLRTEPSEVVDGRDSRARAGWEIDQSGVAMGLAGPSTNSHSIREWSGLKPGREVATVVSPENGREKRSKLHCPTCGQRPEGDREPHHLTLLLVITKPIQELDRASCCAVLKAQARLESGDF